MTSNLDVDSWAEYLGHPQLTIALLQRRVFQLELRVDFDALGTEFGAKSLNARPWSAGSPRAPAGSRAETLA